MGTRHLICVVKNGEYKVAQYGQWDGYPSGQGISVLNFLKTWNREQFEANLEKVSWLSEEESRQRWTECGADPDKEMVSLDIAGVHSEKYPENSRDTGAEILSIIQDHPVKVVNSIDFANDSLWCEWAYVIDLDQNTFEVYTGFNHTPHEGERFSNFNKSNSEEYHPIKLVKTYSLCNLPNDNEFLKDFE